MLAVLGGLGFVATAERPISDSFAGSESCSGCHRELYEALIESRHQKMMRRVGGDDDDIVVADFEGVGSGLRFSRGDAIWAIGGKWEQQFLGRDGEDETLLPGSWHLATKEWDFRGWDGWQRPVPVERCHGCHTVGLDVETGDFLETNIGCESCHGPSAWHVKTWGFGRVYSGVESEVCGQCHSRGTDPTGQYFFPIGYQPGGKVTLEDSFDFVDASRGQDSSHWWGNGHARKRHQEYQAWDQGGHSKSLSSLLSDDYDGRYGEVEDDCLHCHSADYILAGRQKPSISDVSSGVTCAVCHDSHGRLAQVSVDCTTCHDAGPRHHDSQSMADHIPCSPESGVTCVDCHMPPTATIGGAFQLHSHSPGIVEPTSFGTSGAGTSCSNSTCHVDEALERMQELYERFYESASDDVSAIAPNSNTGSSM